VADLAASIARARETVAKANDGMMLPAELVVRRFDDPQIVGQKVNYYAHSDCDGVASIDPDVAPLIVLAVNALPALLDVAEACRADKEARRYYDHEAKHGDYDTEKRGWDRSLEAGRTLDAALARLREVMP
jgi:hypothetical protein